MFRGDWRAFFCAMRFSLPLVFAWATFVAELVSFNMFLSVLASHPAKFTSSFLLVVQDPKPGSHNN